MLRLLAYLLAGGLKTSKEISPRLEPGVRGLPTFSQEHCLGEDCNLCAQVCPTDVVKVGRVGGGSKLEIKIDLGGCIACGLCVDTCPTNAIVNNSSARLAVERRDQLVIARIQNLVGRADSLAAPLDREARPNIVERENSKNRFNAKAEKNHFKRSAALRVVSTGCSACDLEIGAAGNPIFDMERFGLQVVASPRFADFLLVTGPVPLAMHAALKSCWLAMPSPKKVIAVGTCAISGGMHKGSYSKANGVSEILPVDLYIPGCPPHPWTIIHGLRVAMGNDSPDDLNFEQATGQIRHQPEAAEL